jgi:transcriptional regulator with GAF, ATPase, and Fis domain
MSKAEQERDLYRRLLELGDETELEPFLRDALALIVEVTGANQGYLELQDDDGPPWSMAHGFSDEEIVGVRSAISRGIIAEAVATGKTIVTPAAVLDERFKERESVQSRRIGAVLCTPIGTDPVVGVLYLHGRASSSISEDHRSAAEIFARHLVPLVDRLLMRRRAGADETTPLRRALRLPGVIGRSAALAATLRQVALIAPLDTTVLLTGESGTGKSQLARIIHDNGPRAHEAFVEINCAALPEALIESELFGSLPGAHSTAYRKVEGKVTAAERGTLFLDEIGDLTPAAQSKLLHLLQTREYYPLGSSKPVRADVRVIAATNTDLEAGVAERRFRQDLFYRLYVLPIRVPTLAERSEDIEELARHFCAQACRRNHLPALRPSPGAVRAMQTAAWPGNVRQLANAVEAAAIRAAGEGSAQIERGHVFPEDDSPDEPAIQDLTFQEATRRFQARLLREALETSEWNVTEVARRLDLARSYVYILIRAFGLRRSRT